MGRPGDGVEGGIMGRRVSGRGEDVEAGSGRFGGRGGGESEAGPGQRDGVAGTGASKGRRGTLPLPPPLPLELPFAADDESSSDALQWRHAPPEQRAQAGCLLAGPAAEDLGDAGAAAYERRESLACNRVSLEEDAASCAIPLADVVPRKRGRSADLYTAAAAAVANDLPALISEADGPTSCSRSRSALQLPLNPCSGAGVPCPTAGSSPSTQATESRGSSPWPLTVQEQLRGSPPLGGSPTLQSSSSRSRSPLGRSFAWGMLSPAKVRSCGGGTLGSWNSGAVPKCLIIGGEREGRIGGPEEGAGTAIPTPRAKQEGWAALDRSASRERRRHEGGGGAAAVAMRKLSAVVDDLWSPAAHRGTPKDPQWMPSQQPQLLAEDQTGDPYQGLSAVAGQSGVSGAYHLGLSNPCQSGKPGPSHSGSSVSPSESSASSGAKERHPTSGLGLGAPAAHIQRPLAGPLARGVVLFPPKKRGGTEPEWKPGLAGPPTVVLNGHTSEILWGSDASLCAFGVRNSGWSKHRILDLVEEEALEECIMDWNLAVNSLGSGKSQQQRIRFVLSSAGQPGRGEVWLKLCLLKATGCGPEEPMELLGALESAPAPPPRGSSRRMGQLISAAQAGGGPHGSGRKKPQQQQGSKIYIRAPSFHHSVSAKRAGQQAKVRDGGVTPKPNAEGDTRVHRERPTSERAARRRPPPPPLRLPLRLGEGPEVAPSPSLESLSRSLMHKGVVLARTLTLDFAGQERERKAAGASAAEDTCPAPAAVETTAAPTTRHKRSLPGPPNVRVAASVAAKASGRGSALGNWEGGAERGAKGEQCLEMGLVAGAVSSVGGVEASEQGLFHVKQEPKGGREAEPHRRSLDGEEHRVVPVYSQKTPSRLRPSRPDPLSPDRAMAEGSDDKGRPREAALQLPFPELRGRGGAAEELSRALAQRPEQGSNRNPQRISGASDLSTGPPIRALSGGDSSASYGLARSQNGPQDEGGRAQANQGPAERPRDGHGAGQSIGLRTYYHAPKGERRAGAESVSVS